MKSSRKFLVAVLLGLASLPAHADILQDFDTLGGNDVLLDKARALQPEMSVGVVQSRIVNRKRRLELSPEYSNVLGGDAYNNTQNIGFNAHYHFTPQWSVGVKYNYSMNELRPEGEHLIKDSTTLGKTLVPEIDYPKQQYMALVNWYPIYGKMNLYDLGVSHFDIYALAGVGQVQLKSGDASTWTAGGGLGLWLSQHLSTRLELRHQSYTAKRYTGDVNMNVTVAGVQVGYLL